MRRASAWVLLGAVVLALIVTMSVYTVDQRKAAIKFQLGEVIAVQTAPGLYFLGRCFRTYALRTRILRSKRATRTLLTREPQRAGRLVREVAVVDVRQYYFCLARSAAPSPASPRPSTTRCARVRQRTCTTGSASATRS